MRRIQNKSEWIVQLLGDYGGFGPLVQARLGEWATAPSELQDPSHAY